MLRIEDSATRFCDRIPRRSFLQISGLAMGGLSLPQILQAQQQNGQHNSHKAVIMIYLNGGPPHQDMFDLKPDAPAEIRGEFQPIPTNVPGIQISELMPRVAGMMDKFSILRSLVGSDGRHDSFQCCTGHQFRDPKPQGGWPSMGSVLSKLQGPIDPSVPPYIDLSQKMAHDPYNMKGAGFLGMAHTPFRPDGEVMSNMSLNNISTIRLHERTNLLKELDTFRKQVDHQLSTDSSANFTEQALGVLTSSRLLEALDLEKVDPKVRTRYGIDDPKVLGFDPKMGYQALMSRFLQARRAVEAGARMVTCSFADFDYHSDNFGRGRKVIPLLDQGVAALVEDLHERGLEKDVTVLVWGEFGRTPKINKNGGRDHWSRVHAGLMAGGGMQTGQVIGSTNKWAEEAVDRPVHMQEVFATLYHNLGIDTATTTIPDNNGRPQYLLERHQPIQELV
ncbi:DUF1501 domain-containing protein [Gimesia algae]|uniref:DUF1501 domain-containing protein n=1 Tax=Gimesia algae TaxID=2527971 RepID=A0A517VA83_9PLAN|nr:DUF1501 domain-containing protein [Gimesia algae]QDT89906.1 hypothetical protein Pan161_15390 [Gimesia algae]